MADAPYSSYACCCEYLIVGCVLRVRLCRRIRIMVCVCRRCVRLPSLRMHRVIRLHTRSVRLVMCSSSRNPMDRILLNRSIPYAYHYYSATPYPCLVFLRL